MRHISRVFMNHFFSVSIHIHPISVTFKCRSVEITWFHIQIMKQCVLCDVDTKRRFVRNKGGQAEHTCFFSQCSSTIGIHSTWSLWTTVWLKEPKNISRLAWLISSQNCFIFAISEKLKIRLMRYCDNSLVAPLWTEIITHILPPHNFVILVALVSLAFPSQLLGN